MLSSSQPPKPLSENALRQLVKKALDKGWVREAFHSETERAYRNISYDDVLFGLESSGWTLATAPDFDAQHKNWEYLIRTTDVDGDELHLKIVPNTLGGTVKVLTKY